MSNVNMKYTKEKPDILTEMAMAGPRIFLETLKNMSSFIDEIANTSKKLPTLLTLNPQKMCDIPEKECPPRCVCQITWEASPEEKLSCNLKVSNSSNRQIRFLLKALPFSGPAGNIQITPNQIVLDPGQEGVAMVTYAVPATLSPGTYKTEIQLRGIYEQCVKIILNVSNRQPCECEVVQGEIPVRIHAHHWYDHFQCTETCFEPIKERER